MIAYLIAADIERGIKDCRARGWTQIARCLFVTGESRVDSSRIQIVNRSAELPVQPGGTPMLKGSDYESGPGDYRREAWVKEKDVFDRYVTEGAGRWVEL